MSPRVRGIRPPSSSSFALGFSPRAGRSEVSWLQVLRPLAAVLTAVALTGCPKPLVVRPYPPPVASDLLAALRHGHDSVLALRARAKADYLDGAAGRVKIDIGLALAKPNRLRLSGESSLTGPLLTLVTDGQDFQLLDVRRNSFMAGRVNPCSMARLIRVALHPAEAVEVLVGGVPLLSDGEAAAPQLDWSGKDGGREVLTLRDARGRTEVLWLAPRPGGAPGLPSGWDVREAEGRDPGGQVVWRVRHEDFSEVALSGEGGTEAAKPGRTVRLPAVTYIEDPPHKSDVRLRWRERELNPSLEPGIFHMDAPAGVPTEPDLCADAGPPSSPAPAATPSP